MIKCNFFERTIIAIVFEFVGICTKLGFTSRSTARVILGQVLRIATCGTQTHRGDSL